VLENLGYDQEKGGLYEDDTRVAPLHLTVRTFTVFLVSQYEITNLVIKYSTHKMLSTASSDLITCCN
jgi:hypothetical protein